MTQRPYPFNLLDKCHVDFDENQPFEIFETDARSLLSQKRYDLYAILLYIDHKVKGLDTTYALEVYRERTRAATGFSFKEAGNDSKNSFAKFIEILDSLIDIFSAGSFDPNLSIIPVDKNNVLIDGAHRVACAAYFNKNVTVVKFIALANEFNLNYLLLEEKFVPTTVLDAMALEYCNYHKNIYMLVFWPKSFRNESAIEKAFSHVERNSNIVYRKKMKLNYTGTRNLILQIYGHMDWIGTIDDQHKNTYGKANEVYDKSQKFEFVLIEADSFKEVFDLKQEIRALLEIDLASIHSTDNWHETYQIANLIYNQNCIHHLETSEPDKYGASYKLVQEYKKSIEKLDHDLNDYVLDASIVMAIYGIRQAGDLDYLTIYQPSDELSRLSSNQELIEDHTDSSHYYDCSVDDLIYNPSNYFVFNDTKFVSLENLYRYKMRRAQKTDVIDARLIKMYGTNNKKSFKYFILKFKNDFNRLKYTAQVKSILTLFSILKKIGIYKILRKIYHCLVR